MENIKKSDENKEKPILVYVVVHPKNFRETVIKTGKYDPLKLAKDGMVLCFETIQPKDKMDTVLKEAGSMFTADTMVITINSEVLDEWIEDCNTAFKLVKTTGKIGYLALRIFVQLQFLTDIFSKEKMREFDKAEQDGEGRSTAGYFSKPFFFVNETMEKKGFKHCLLFISTHKYLVEGDYFDTLIDRAKIIFKQHYQKMKEMKKPNGM